MTLHESSRTRRSAYQEVSRVSRKKLLFLGIGDGKLREHLIAHTPDRHTTNRTYINTPRPRAATQSQRPEQQVHRRTDHLGEIASSGNLLAQVSKRAKSVDEFLGRGLHQRVNGLSEWSR